MLTTVRLTPGALKAGKTISLHIGGRNFQLTSDSPQLDLKGINLLELERSLIGGQIRAHVASKMLQPVVIPDSGVVQGNQVTAGAAGGVTLPETTEQSTATGPVGAPSVGMIPEMPSVAGQVVPGANIVQRNVPDPVVKPIPLVPAAEPVGEQGPSTSQIATAKAPAAVPSEASEAPEVAPSAEAESASPPDAKTASEAPEWKANRTLTQQEDALNASVDKEFLQGVLADSNESDRLKLVAERRLAAL